MGTKVCISIFLIILLTPPIIIFALTFVTKKPILYIEDLYIPALNNSTQSTNSTRLNTFIFIDLKIKNLMPFNGIRYGDLNLIFFYGSNRTVQVGNHTVAGFYQGLKKTAHKRAVVRTRGLPWDDALGRVSSGSVVDIGVKVATTVKLRRCGRYMEREAVVVGADVRLDGSGEEVNGKTIRLN